MSACETAKGEQKTGEGVYGLRKAISDAGAEYVMMSLWKVDDKVTQEFMTTFYTYWLEDKMSIREAFKSTRSTIKSKYPQPYYWGAFILSGGKRRYYVLFFLILSSMKLIGFLLVLFVGMSGVVLWADRPRFSENS